MRLHNMFKKTVGKEHGTSKNTKVRNNLIRLGSVEEELLDQGIKPNTIRLSIGTEHIDDIIQDLDEAFKAVE